MAVYKMSREPWAKARQSLVDMLRSQTLVDQVMARTPEEAMSQTALGLAGIGGHNFSTAADVPPSWIAGPAQVQDNSMRIQGMTGILERILEKYPQLQEGLKALMPMQRSY